MSPSSRSSSRRNSSGGFKPYTRGVSPIMLASVPDGCQDKPPNSMERPGFPTYAQYKQVEATYLNSLTPRRQGKALISQALFDRIWDVLHQPDSQGETAQFRFWARKMFTLSKNHRVSLGVDENGEEAPQEVLLHDNLLVAIQEQLYDLLCYCHGSTGHGGRDKTCALIRKHYTWVPKDLVSNFIKACPTCIMKKCGNPDGAAAMAQMTDSAKLDDSPFPVFRDFFQQNMYHPDSVVAAAHDSPIGNEQALPWPMMGDVGAGTSAGPKELPMPPSMLDLGDGTMESVYRNAMLRSRKNTVGANGTAPRGLQSYPMVREVSLYKGLPNGWQFRHSDYAAAHAEFMRTKDLPQVEEYTASGTRVQRPRVPSILPLWGPERFSNPEYDEHDLADQTQESILSMDRTMSSSQADDGHSSAMTMHYLLMSSDIPPETKQEKEEYIPHIDPLLMGFSEHAPSSLPTQDQQQPAIEHEELPSASDSQGPDAESPTLGSSTNFPSSSSIKRAAAPLRLNIDFPNERTIQALLAYRDSMGEGNVTPDSPLTAAWNAGNPSPASSDSSSSSSQLSAFPMSSTGTTPGSSALTTPVDECGGEDKKGESCGSDIVDKGKGKHVLSEVGEATLSQAIEAACGI
ncbi:hypothetical protein JR316_0011072 [Psilocybe cubensis]|uniref:Integrase zinc-binding domain-containing protein n=2 Tax=Psilocybe cubensis TaxID=181762 RepID=A0A8H7XMI6_PSICU|nr:hypothetical protein JR316_0011072 [Psilocybe cubensis]KAH9477155.1 hypothetical protein JR316_0011072 [Psilocybe cubensis]